MAVAGPRLHSLDLLRGAAIVGMVLVNEPAVGPPFLYRQLTHSPWNGWTFADTVFPVFLFAMGAVLSTRGRFVRRAVILFALGLALNALPLVLTGSSLLDIRIMGVLQRIALAGLLATVLARRLPRSWLLPAAGVILLATWAVLVTKPLTPTGNLPGWIDRHVLGVRHMYPAGHGGYDPEGLFGTIPAAAGVLLGAWAGDLLRAGRRVVLAGSGVAMVVAGEAWSHTLPINKRLWTPSFVVLMTGIAILCTVALSLLGPHGVVLRMIGANPLVVYLGTEATGIVTSLAHHGRLPLPYWVWSRWLGADRFGALVWALGILALWWVVAAVLWWRRWLVRV